MKTTHGPLDQAHWRLQAMQMVIALGQIRDTLHDGDTVRRQIDAERAEILKALWPETKP